MYIVFITYNIYHLLIFRYTNETKKWEKCKSLFVEKFSIKNNNVFYKVMAQNVR